MTIYHQPGAAVRADVRFPQGRELAAELVRDGVPEDVVMTVLGSRPTNHNPLIFDASPELLLQVPGRGEKWVDQRKVMAA